MFDKYPNRQIINLDPFDFISNRFEIWSQGQMIKSVKDTTFLSFCPNEGTNSTDVEVDTTLLEDDIDSNMTFDVCYTNGDRLLLAIIPKKSNCDTIDSFATFKSAALVVTREYYEFGLNEPHACSIFLIGGQLSKITFSIARTKKLIEFYVD